jgi:hypothetical protein
MVSKPSGMSTETMFTVATMSRYSPSTSAPQNRAIAACATKMSAAPERRPA